MRILVTGGAGYTCDWPSCCAGLFSEKKRFAHNPSEAARLLGWKARFGLDDMCQDAWRWQSIHPQGYGTQP